MFAAADLAHLLVDEFSRLSGGRFAGALILAGFLYRASLWHDQSPSLAYSSVGSQQRLIKAMARHAGIGCREPASFGAVAPHGDARGYFQGPHAVCPGSKSEGVFFLRCGTIFVGSGFPGTPRGPNCSRWMSSSDCRGRPSSI